MFKHKLLSVIFLITCFLPSISAQTVKIIPEKSVLQDIINDNQRDSAHLSALDNLMFYAASDRMSGQANSEGSTEYIDSLLQETYKIGEELGGVFPVRARIAQIRMDARLCPQYTSERRNETVDNYLALHDSLMQHPGRENSQLIFEAYDAIHFQCTAVWSSSEENLEHGEAIYKDSLLSTSEHLQMANLLINNNLAWFGDINRALTIIQETLNLLKTTEGEHGMKFSIYQLLSNFFEQSTSDYEKALEMLLLAKENALQLDADQYGHLITFPDTRIIDIYEKQGKYEQAEALLDSLKNAGGIIPSDKNLDEVHYLTEKIKYCNKLSKEDCSENLELLIAALDRPEAEDLDAHTTFYAETQIALYYCYREDEKSAYPWYVKADQRLEWLRFFDPEIAIDLRLAYAAELQRRREFEKSLSRMASVSSLQNYVINGQKTSAQKRALYDLNVRDYRQKQERAEEIAIAKEKEVNTNRRFYLGLLGAAGLVLVFGGYTYWRSRRDALKLSAQKKLVDQSLSEKEVLLREIHHRVKNNLQIISSLLQKQARQSESQELKDMILDGQERIQSMALIHQNLYQSDQLGGVNINDYLLDLTQSVEKSHGSDPGNINIELQVADEHLDIDTAIPLGLILNELITNAYKYAFPDGQVGKVIIKFYREAEQYILRVSDDGVGLPSDYEVRKSHSLGLNLVNGLVRQLEGTIDWRQETEGTAVSIRFGGSRANPGA